MNRLSLLLRQWRNRPGRAIATAASVAVAVGAVVATWLSADASREGYRRLAESIEGVPSIDITPRETGRWDGSGVPKLIDIPGVRAVVPLVYKPALLRSDERRIREVAVGVDAGGLVDAGFLKLVEGRACEKPDEIVVSRTLADSLDKSLDDTLLFLTRRGGYRTMKITGIADPQSLAALSDGGGVVVDIESLGELTGVRGLIDRFRLVLRPEASRQAVLAAVNERLPEKLHAIVPAGRASMAHDMLNAANLGLDFVTALTVAMAWFIVGNAMLMNVTERRRSFALQRVLGATSRQISRMLFWEAAAIGAVGAGIGAVGGILAAGPIAKGIGRAIRAPDFAISYNPWIVVAAVLIGPAVAVLAAWWPTRQAAKVDLLESLAHMPPPPENISWKLVTTAAVLWSFAVGILVAVVTGVLPPRSAVPAGIATTLAFIATTPVVLPLLARLLAGFVPSKWRIEGALALEQILRQPVRTALTTGVLVVAVSNGVGLGHAIRDNVDDVLAWYAKALKADWMLLQAGALGVSRETSPSAGSGLVEEVSAIEGVASVQPISIAIGSAGGVACVIVARDMPGNQPLPLEAVGMSDDELRAIIDEGGLVAGTALAQRLKVKVGDEVAVSAFGRTIRANVAALVVDYTAGGTSLFLSREAARRIFGIDSVDALLIESSPEAAAGLREPLQAVAKRHGLLLQSHADLHLTIDRIINGIVGALWSILGLGFIVGSLGVANTVTMNVLEKRRTLGLLRAVGMTARQVTRLVVIESLLLGLSGCIIGILGGIVSAWFIQLSSQPLLGHPVSMSFRPDVILSNLAAAIAITAIAAWLPARRAVRLDLLDSIAAE